MFHVFLVSKNETGQETPAAVVLAPGRALPASLLPLQELPLDVPVSPPWYVITLTSFKAKSHSASRSDF